MKGKCVLTVIHLHIAMVFTDGFSDAFYPKAMSAFVRLTSGQAAFGIRKGIAAAGIYDGYDDEWRAVSLACVDFNKGIGNAVCSFKCVVQQVAEQGG